MKKYLLIALLFAAMLAPCAHADSFTATFECNPFGGCGAPTAPYGAFSIPGAVTVEWGSLTFETGIQKVDDLTDTFDWYIRFGSDWADLEIREFGKDPQSLPVEVWGGQVPCTNAWFQQCYWANNEDQYGPMILTPIVNTPESSSLSLMLAGAGLLGLMTAMRRRIPLGRPQTN